MKTLNIKKTTWHARLFQVANDIWQKFLEGYEYHDVQTNRCYYIRTILFSAPFAILVNLGLVVSAVYVLTYKPYSYFGWTPFIGAAVIVGVVIGGSFVRAFIQKHMPDTYLDRMEASQKAVANAERKAACKEEKGPGFFELVWGWLKDFKEAHCPIINFLDEETE